jgi:replicative DNA helicase
MTLSSSGSDTLHLKGSAQAGAPLSTRTIPHNLDAEEGLLASCILDGGQETMTLCIEAKLQFEAFYKPAHQVIFQSLQALYERGNCVDEIILSDYLESRTLSTLPAFQRDVDRNRSLLEFIGGASVIRSLTSRVETPVHAKYWLAIVREKWMLRRMIHTATQVVDRCYRDQDQLDHFIEQVEQEIFSISQDRVVDSAQHISKSVEAASMMIQKLLQGDVSQGVMTGFMDLDKMTFGLHPQEMIVLAARPSMGKTSLAMNIAEHACIPQHGKAAATLVFSLEMGGDQLAMRMLCGRAKVNIKRVRDRILTKEDQHRIFSAAKDFKQSQLWIDDSGHATILELRAKARRIHARNSLGLIIIDYLQLINGTDSRVPREQQIAEISRGIKAMAKELNLPVIVLSQLNRESEKEKRQPRLSDLRESGSIEQDADVVLLLAKGRDSENDDSSVPMTSNMRELIIAKNRNGPVGNIPLTFIPDYTRFENFIAQPE